MDRILIRDLLVRGVIGVNEDERMRPQDILINVEMLTDTRAAGASDDLADTVDYGAVSKEIVALVEGSRYLLVERLAEEIARLCLAREGVQGVRVRVEKPRALRYGRSVGVEIERMRGGEDRINRIEE